VAHTLIRRYYACFNDRRFSDAIELFTPDAILEYPPFSAGQRGPACYLAFAEMWTRAFPDGIVTIEHVEQRGDTICEVDLIANGTVNGVITGLLYVPSSGLYQTGSTTYTQAQLITFIQNGDTLTVMGVPPGSGQRMGPDRKLVQSHAKSKTQH